MGRKKWCQSHTIVHGTIICLPTWMVDFFIVNVKVIYQSHGCVMEILVNNSSRCKFPIQSSESPQRAWLKHHSPWPLRKPVAKRLKKKHQSLVIGNVIPNLKTLNLTRSPFLQCFAWKKNQFWVLFTVESKNETIFRQFYLSEKFQRYQSWTWLDLMSIRHPLTGLEIPPWMKMYVSYWKMMIFQCHLSFQGCNSL